ncbi:MAG: IclR family transcriptional regulator [Chloroflexota bacterium]
MTTARDRPPEEAQEDTSFARGLRLLLTVADRGEVRADELSVLLDTPLSTVYRYLRTLAEFGFVDRQGPGYRLGPRLLIGGGANVSSETIIRVANPVTRSLAEETGETVVVTRRVGLAAVCLQEVPSRHRLRVSIEPGSSSPLYAGAIGRVLLAFAPPELVDQVVAEGVTQLTPATPTASDLASLLAAVVRDGIARSEGELVDGSVSIAVPIFSDDGIVAALGVVGPASRCGPAWRSRAEVAARRAAGAIMHELRRQGPPSGA